MKIARHYCRTALQVSLASFVLTALALAQSSGETSSNDVAWGEPKNGVRIGIEKLAPNKDGPRFRVHLMNVGDKDLLLHLGVTIGTGHKPDAIHLLARDSEGKTYRLPLVYVVGGAMTEMDLPLSPGGTYTTILSMKERVILHPDSQPIAGDHPIGSASARTLKELPRGNYEIAVEYKGESVKRSMYALPYWKETVRSSELEPVPLSIPR